MEVLAALVPLLVMLIERWITTAPQRERAKLEAEYDRDVATLTRALAAGDHETVTRLFELERKEARRRALRDAGAGEPAAELPARSGAADHSGGPDDHAAG